MIAVGAKVWWWDRAWGAWELFTIVEEDEQSPMVMLRRGDGKLQLARRGRIPSSTYRFAQDHEFRYAETWDFTGRHEQLKVAV